VNEIVPEESPFGCEEFALSWHGWQGRQAMLLSTASYHSYYVRRRVGPLHTHDALPFGTPAFVDDLDNRFAEWIERFFAIRGSIRSSLTLYRRPSRSYYGVDWTARERLVVPLGNDWRSRVAPEVRRRARRASESEWEIRELSGEELALADSAIKDTARRHDAPARFSTSFYTRLRGAVAQPGRLVMLGALRDGDVGGLRVIFAARGYQASWIAFASDRARAEGVGPLLALSWLEYASERGARFADFGVSPSHGVREFKASFGAVPQYLHTGTRHWHLWGH
jgi:hypothetical protein